jgi:hypothetical protein
MSEVTLNCRAKGFGKMKQKSLKSERLRAENRRQISTLKGWHERIKENARKYAV